MQSTGEETLEVCKKYFFSNTYLPHNEKIMPNFPLVFTQDRIIIFVCLCVYAFWGRRGSAVHCIVCIILVNVHIFTEKENDKQIYWIFLRLNGKGNLSIQSFSAVIALSSQYTRKMLIMVIFI